MKPSSQRAGTRTQRTTSSWPVARAFYLLPTVFFSMISGCVSYVPVAGGDNFAYIYGKGAAAVRLQARVYHGSEERSTIWFKLRTRDLLYKNSGGSGPFRAKVLLKYEAYPEIGSNQLLDSASTYVKDTSEDPTEDKELIGSLDMKRNDQRAFVLKITARDLNRDTESTVFIPVDRGMPGHRQSFLPLSERGVPLFDDHVPAGTHVRVLCEQHAGRTLLAEHLLPPGKLPMPVFTTGGERPAMKLDSTWTLTVGADGSFHYTADSTGFTHFRIDTAFTTGFTLFTFANTYPTVRTSPDMVPPMRYITSLQEWDRITGATDQRREVEKFWTDAAGSRDRAREAIDAYYSRVESANRHFTGWTEGWKTDRGLVHIIFGTPNTIRKTGESEVWTYGEETNLMSLSFVFEKRPGPYSDNDLVLRRDPNFKTAWYRNVESWRNGRVFQN
jgi:GWxTD domain-containing protein